MEILLIYSTSEKFSSLTGTLDPLHSHLPVAADSPAGMVTLTQAALRPVAAHFVEPDDASGVWEHVRGGVLHRFPAVSAPAHHLLRVPAPVFISDVAPFVSMVDGDVTFTRLLPVLQNQPGLTWSHGARVQISGIRVFVHSSVDIHLPEVASAE